MLLAVIALQAIVLLLVALLLTRKAAPIDQRLNAVPDAIIALNTKLETIDSALRNNVTELRNEQARTSRELREEINQSIERLSRTLTENLAVSRTDNTTAANQLREALARDLNTIGERLNTFFAESGKSSLESQEALHRALHAMSAEQREDGKQLRNTVEANLKSLNTDNAAKLEEMRATVDEKLQKTLNERLTQSFGAVSDQLTKVHTGLGEMKELATGVSDLKKVFSNVRSRGNVGEFALGLQLEQMFSREQYLVNPKIKQTTNERVEFALKIPDGDANMLLPIDAKFPREARERLEHAYEHGSPEELASAGAAFERAIRTEGKRICEKYIDPPTTTPYAIMFLPTEALYAEVMRRPGLQAELQNNCNVTVAGPSTFMAILTSLQMGFRTLAIQKKGNEVWKVLSSVKKEFSTFEILMTKVEDNVKTVQNALGKIGTRTRVINKKLHDVGELNAPPAATPSGLLAFDDLTGVAPLLAAIADDE